MYIFPVTPSYSQGADLIRQRLQNQQRELMRQPDVDVPSIGEGRIRERFSDVLPEEVPLFSPEQSLILLDEKIDPSKYILGPGDLMIFYFWGEIDKNYLLRVTPEGYLIIPTVGPVMVADKTLAEIKEEVKSIVNENYEGLRVSFFLKEPRRFRLYVSGVVYVPGMHESHGSERVSDIMDRAGLIIPGKVSDIKITSR